MKKRILVLIFLLGLGGCEGCQLVPDALVFSDTNVSSGCAVISGHIQNVSKYDVYSVHIHYSLSPSGTTGTEYPSFYSLRPDESGAFSFSPSGYSGASSIKLELAGDSVSGAEKTLTCP